MRILVKDCFFFLRIKDLIGSGQFGTVHEGVWKQSTVQSIAVAAKVLNESATEVDGVKFLQEAAIMAQFRHPNVIALHGVAKKDGKVSLVHCRVDDKELPMIPLENDDC